MATTLQLRRGTTAQNDAFTGAEGELSIDTTLDQLRIHDGATAGGFKAGRQVDVDDRMQVANTIALYNSAVANLVSTVNVASYMAVSNTQALHTSITANLNSYIANTNPRITNILSSVSGTNTAIRAIVSNHEANTVTRLDNRMTVANTQALVNARLGATATVAITGAVAGGATAFSSNAVSISVTQQNDSVTLGTHTTGNYVATISGTTNEIEVSGSGSETAAVTIGLPNDVTLTGDLTVSGGDITLGGTGRIQGIDTVSAGTDAANKTYVDNAVAGIVDSAPAALDTLNELAAALGDDANFATTVSTNIGQKLGATASVTLTGDVTGSASFSSNAVSITTTVADDSHNHIISNVDGLQAALDNRMTVANTQSLANARLGATATVTLTGDVTGGATAFSGNAVSVSTSIASGVVGATELAVTGNGTTAQFLRSDGDGTFTWATPTDTDTTYTAGGDYGLTLSGTEFRLEDDRRRNSSTTDIYDGNTHDYIHYDADVGMRFYTNNAEDMRLEDDGDLHVDGNITAYSTTVSDKRLKEDLVKVDNALSKVCSLTGYEFTYTPDGKRSAGVIAQDVEEVLPSAITETTLPLKIDDGNEYKVLQYDQLSALYIEAIKELKEEIDVLKAEISVLKGE